MTPELREKLNYACRQCYKGTCSAVEVVVDDAIAEATAALEAERDALKKTVVRAERERDIWRLYNKNAEDDKVRIAAERDAALQREARLREELQSFKGTVIVTIGGTDDEGNPVSEINYLQRLRALVKIEKRVAQLRAALDYTERWFDEMANEGTLNATVDLRAAIRDALAATQEDV